MEQERALEALQQFLALSKSASTPAIAADLITRATSHPSTYLFGPLLYTPNIDSLAISDTHSPHYAILKLFSYGTYSDYASTPSLPALTPAQTLKLRQLSLLTLASDAKNLTYDVLLKELALSTARELEDLVITSIYAGLLTCTLDPYNQILRISSVAPLRDLAPDKVPHMLKILAEWSRRCGTTLADLEAEMQAIKSAGSKRRKEEKEWEERIESLVENGGKKKDDADQDGENAAGRVSSSAGKRLGAGVASKRALGVLGGDDDGEAGDGDVEMVIDDDEDGDAEETQRLTRSSKKRGGLGGRNLGGK